ncbi:uncharacterized protein LOC114534548 [Dendronephthya gigantea]|uniref:uncharacterized protein LOC114534548 n=1 Tax=Dendronephthya gigantea TaxID=151771 RepID=UPI00106BEBB3|nr:uncharacterized protein LOC114534548 [Dendronephthya gigantea]
MVDVVLRITLGLFVKKARSLLCEKLKDGGLNSQELRRLIMSNLQDIQTQLTGLARGNLLTSASNLQEGLRLLDASVPDEPNTLTLPLQQDDKTSKLDQGSSCRKDSHLDVDAVSGLTEAIDKMKVNSSDHFLSAMESFKNANTEATKAFHNEALSVEDRVLATKLRVQSRILLSLENASLAKEPCRLYLEELHGLSSIVEIFHNEFEGGMLALLNKEKRHELVLSVSAINVVVFNFLKKFTEAPISLYDWPNLNKSAYNPLIPDKNICVELQNSEIKIPGLFVVENVDRNISKQHINSVTVNSDGQLFLGTKDFRTGQVTFLKIAVNDVKIHPFQSQHQFFVAIDSYDNIYVLTDNDCPPEGSDSLVPIPCTLFAFDSKEIETNRFEVGNCGSCDKSALVPTPDGFVLVNYNEATSAEVAFYRNNGGKAQRTSSFPIKISWERLLCTVTNKYQVVVVEEGGFHVHVYEKDGQVTREFELYGGKDESCVSIAFNYLTEEVVFVTRVGSWYFLSTYVIESGERRLSTRLTLFGKISSEDIRYYWKLKSPHLTSHYKGPMALVSNEYVLYIQ